MDEIKAVMHVMSDFKTEDLIYDWNVSGGRPSHELKLNDETLRDGLQSPSIADPAIEDKLKILHLMEDLACLTTKFIALCSLTKNLVLKLCAFNHRINT